MTEPKTAKHIVTAADAGRVYSWLMSRGGIRIWKSVNLSNPGASWTTPGDVLTKPTWQAGNDSELITDPADVVVSIDREVKRFYVALRRSSNGLMLKVTDGGSRRIWAAIAKAGDGAYHTFDYGTQEAVIWASDVQIPITKYMEAKQ